MDTLTLRKDAFYQSILAGAKSVIKQKDVLNAINVFPVADGDTGTNLASLMEAILNENPQLKDCDQRLLMIADRALEGARGNSGIIFAQYLNGLIYELNLEKDEISTTDLLNAMDQAVKYAYESVVQPVEGTMITLMREFSETLNYLHQQFKDLVTLFTKAFDKLKDLLSKTTQQLDVLEKNHVVDAGAKGFYHFVEGQLMYLKDGIMDKMYQDSFDKASGKNEEPHDDEPFKDGDFRYCTEALLTGDNLSAKDIKIALHDLGNSMVVAGNPYKVRVHIHTNEPHVVFMRLKDFGHIESQKVDDMKRQHEVKNARKYDTVVVTDSIADLPQSLIDQYQIQQMPIVLTIDGVDYYDKLTMTAETFYESMDHARVYPKTTQPNLKKVINFLSYLSTYYKKIIIISVSSKMSGTYNVYVQAAKTLDENIQIEVIDSKQNSGAEGLLVLKAGELIDQGLQFEEIVSKIKALTSKSKILVRVKTLKYMVRGGRVSKITGFIGKLINLKPVVSIDDEGNGIIYAKGFSLGMSTKTIFKHMQKVIAEKGIEKYAIVYAKRDAATNQFIKQAKEITGMDPVYEMDISAIVAMHAGIGTVAIAYIEKNE